MAKYVKYLGNHIWWTKIPVFSWHHQSFLKENTENMITDIDAR